MSKITNSLKDEVAAAKSYRKLISRLNKKSDKRIVKGIRRDEIRHARLLRKMRKKGE